MSDDAARPQQAGMVTIDQLIALLMISRERIGQLVREGHVPKAAKGVYPLVGAVQGYIRFLKDNAKQTSKSAASSRASDARAREIELRIAEREGKLVLLEDSLGVIEEITGLYVAGMGALPARSTRDPLVRRKIESECDELRKQLAEKCKQCSAALRSGGPLAVAEPEDDA
jgi:23S rRNA A1618 N6-methylase RlmF